MGAPLVLIVEDDQDVAVAIQNVLRVEGYEGVIASTVADASASMEGLRPALVLLDWNLPDGCGADVVRAIRPHDASVPIVVMSAARDSLEASLSVDARERLSKPFDLGRLVEILHRYCR